MCPRKRHWDSSIERLRSHLPPSGHGRNPSDDTPAMFVRFAAPGHHTERYIMTFRFLVIADTHFVRTPNHIRGEWWNRTTEQDSDIMGEALVRKARELAPDMAVHCGDFNGWNDATEYACGAAYMDRLGCPWIAVPGNHDTWEPVPGTPGNPFASPGLRSRAVDAGGVRFLLLDTASWLDRNGTWSPLLDRVRHDRGEIEGMGASPADLEWLERELETLDRPAILVTHAPVEYRSVYPVATLPRGGIPAGPETPPSAFVGGMTGIGRIRELLRNNRMVRACFAGHWHLNDAVEHDGVLHVMTGALREYPFDVRLVELHDGGMRITTQRLDVPELIEFSFVREWGNRWIEGDAAVRDFEYQFPVVS